MSAALSQAAQEYAAELADMGVAQEYIDAAALGYTRGWQDKNKEET